MSAQNTSSQFQLTSAHANSSVDFISKLPTEIVLHNILPRIVGRQPVRLYLDDDSSYFNVCSAWSERFALLVDDNVMHWIGHNNSLTDGDMTRIAAAAPFLQSLFIHTSRDSLFRLGHSIRFSSLTNVLIYLITSQDSIHRLLKAMPELKHMEIKLYDPQQRRVRTWELLDQCPKLIHVKLTHGHSMPIATIPDRHPVYPNVLYLEIFTRTRLRRDLITPFIKHFPNLTALRLPHPHSQQVHNAINQYFPKLRQLFIGPPTNTSQMNATAMPDHDDGQGLRLFHLTTSGMDNVHFQQLMMQHHETLVTIVLETSLRAVTNIGNHNVEFQKLSSIECPPRMPEQSMLCIQWLVRHAPMLETVNGSPVSNQNEDKIPVQTLH